jgi:hypothetical protein
MTSPSVSSEDAIQLYLLATAYLHDATIGSSSLTSTLYTREWSGTTFCIWRRTDSAAEEKPRAPAAPVALCTYQKKTKSWEVELRSGETLTLLDEGEVWEIPGQGGMIPLCRIPKQKRPGRKKYKRT